MPKRRLPRSLLKLLEENGETLASYWKLGGIRGAERRAAAKAIREEQEFRLQMLEEWYEWYRKSGDVLTCARLNYDIAYLRRRLKIPNPQTTVEARRAQTRERVRRYRERQKEQAKR